MSQYKLVCALGNPGREYEQTKHNIGQMVFDYYRELEAKSWKEKFKGLYTDLSIEGEKVFFLKPLTYMNLSGESVKPLISFFKIKPHEILILHDELDLEFGRIAFKKGGGLAGHNGLKSIAAQLGTQDFYRMRIGIGRPVHGDVSNWVLSRFSNVSEQELEIVLEKCATSLDFALKNDFSKLMNKFNKKNFLPSLNK